MKLTSSKRSSLTPRGMTLIELMIVVAIIAILAALAIPAFTGYIKRGKIAQLQQYAMDIARGQEQYRSRNNLYFNPTATIYAQDDVQWAQLLEFNAELPSGVIIETQAGIGNTPNCTICDIAPFGIAASQAWYAVRVRQSLNDDPTTFTTVIITSNEMRAIVLNEFQ